MTPQALLSAKRNSVSLSLLAAVLLLSLIWIGLSFPRGFFRPAGYPPIGNIFLQEPAPGAGFLNRRRPEERPSSRVAAPGRQQRSPSELRGLGLFKLCEGGVAQAGLGAPKRGRQ
jgi:hypothetical protein